LAQNLSDIVDDGDLPDLPAKTQPRHPQTQQWESHQQPAQPQRQARPKPPEAPKAPAAQPHVHTPYIQTSAQQFGLSDEEIASTPTAVLERFVARLQAGTPKAEPAPEPKKAEEPAFDWGEDADGKPLTEAEAKATYSRPIFNAIKNQARLEAVEKQNAELKAEITKDRQQRQYAVVRREVNTILAERPELFGKTPGKYGNDPESAIQKRRFEAVWNHLKNLGDKSITLEQDVADALLIFGPASKAKPTQTNGHTPVNRLTEADVRAAELGGVTQRRGGATLDLRERLIQQKEVEMREMGYNPQRVYDDDSDLPEIGPR
jgi:hypothetical protein